VGNKAFQKSQQALVGKCYKPLLNPDFLRQIMNKILLLIFTLISMKVTSQKVAIENNCICYIIENKAATISLQKFIKKIKTENKSLKNIEKVNVIVDGILIEKISEYKIDKSCVMKVEVLIKDPHGVNRDGTKPSILITTNLKNNGY
jgi:hypothetical protein